MEEIAQLNHQEYIRMKKSAALIVALFTLLTVAVVPAFAQTSRSLTFTEAQVNSAYAVSNPRNRNLSNVFVDLQANQVVISATYTVRTSRTSQAYPVTATIIPSLSNGRVVWNVANVTVASQSASAALISQINASIDSSWRRYVNSNAPTGRVTGITLTDADVTYTYSSR